MLKTSVKELKDKMALKSYRLLKKGKKKKRKPLGDIVTGGVTAIIGVGLLGQTASAVGRI